MPHNEPEHFAQNQVLHAAAHVHSKQAVRGACLHKQACALYPCQTVWQLVTCIAMLSL